MKTLNLESLTLTELIALKKDKEAEARNLTLKDLDEIIKIRREIEEIRAWIED